MSAKRVLLVGDVPIWRELLAETLHAKGYEVRGAHNGEEAGSCSRKDKPDVILVDVDARSRNELSILGTIRKTANLKSAPVIVLADVAQRECVLDAVRNGVAAYLIKSRLSLADLLSRVEACGGAAAQAPPAAPAQPATGSPRPAVAAPATRHAVPAPTASAPGILPASPADLTQIITEKELLHLIGKGLELKSLGPTVQNVMAVTSAAECSVEDVAKAVGQDQALSIRVLKLAHSSAYARGRPVGNLKEAVQRVGVREVRALTMTLGVLEQNETCATERLDPRLFWEHSIACGLIATMIAKARRTANAEAFFLWGMVHDVGRLILANYATEAYARVYTTAERFDLPLEDLEARLLPLDHSDVLRRALEHWQFPAEFGAAVVHHNRPASKIQRLEPKDCERAAIVALANRIAHILMLGSSGNDVIYPLEDLIELLELPPSLIAEISRSVPDELHDLKFSMLARSHQEGWPDFAATVRDEMGAGFRPICVAVAPELDGCRYVVERLRSKRTDQPPNVGVIYLREAGQLSVCGKRLEAEERSKGVEGLPVVVICHQGKLEADHPWLRNRQHAVLKLPLRIRTLVNAIRELTAVPMESPALACAG